MQYNSDSDGMAAYVEDHVDAVEISPSKEKVYFELEDPQSYYEEQFSRVVGNSIKATVSDVVLSIKSLKKMSKRLDKIKHISEQKAPEGQKMTLGKRPYKRKHAEVSQAQSEPLSQYKTNIRNSMKACLSELGSHVPSSQEVKKLAENQRKSNLRVVESTTDTASSVSSSSDEEKVLHASGLGKSNKERHVVDKNKKGKSKAKSRELYSSNTGSMFVPEDLAHPRSSEWYPPLKVAKYLAKRIRKPLQKEVRNRMKSECPRPSISSKAVDTPEIDQKILAFAGKYSRHTQSGIDWPWRECQDRLLDVVGPLAKILEMAHQAKESNSTIDPTVLVGLAQMALCFVGNANCAISAERRKSILLNINPRWTDLATEEPGPSANGLLFGNKFAKEIAQFVQSFNSMERSKLNLQTFFPKKVFARAVRGRGRSTSQADFASSSQYRGGYQKQPHQPAPSPFYPTTSRFQRARVSRDHGRGESLAPAIEYK